MGVCGHEMSRKALQPTISTASSVTIVTHRRQSIRTKTDPSLTPPTPHLRQTQQHWTKRSTSAHKKKRQTKKDKTQKPLDRESQHFQNVKSNLICKFISMAELHVIKTLIKPSVNGWLLYLSTKQAEPDEHVDDSCCVLTAIKMSHMFNSHFILNLHLIILRYSNFSTWRCI